MKWVLFSAIGITLIFPIYAMSKVVEKFPHPPPNNEEEPDLFKKDDQVYSGHVELLYWSLAEGGLDYALKMEHAPWIGDQNFAQGRSENATYGIDPGFRLALIYFRAPRYWEIKWQYTRMTNRGINRIEKPSAPEQYLTGTWPQIFPNSLWRAKSSIHFNYNVFEWVADRVFFPNPHLRLRTFGGMTAAWMDQDWKVWYFQNLASNTTLIRNRWQYVGAGLKTATMADWYWTKELYLTTLVSFSLLMGSYSNQSFQSSTYLGSPNGIRDTFYRDVRPTMSMQMLLGPSWQKNLPKNRIEIFTGFEMNMWFNLQEIHHSTSGTPVSAKETWVNSSLLSLYGLSTRLTLDF